MTDKNNLSSEKLLEELQKRSDFEASRETFGTGSESGPTKAEFAAYRRFLVFQIQQHKNEPGYYYFLSEFMKNLCSEIESVHVTRYATELMELKKEQHDKEEKDKADEKDVEKHKNKISPAKKDKRKQNKKPGINASDVDVSYLVKTRTYNKHVDPTGEDDSSDDNEGVYYDKLK